MADLLKEIMDDGGGFMKDRFLTFRLGDEIFGVAVSRVKEIVGLQAITEMPDYIKGIVNLRGGIIPVMDVRLRFQKPPAEYDDRTCVIVIAFGSSSVGLIVDSVSEVLTISEEDISKKPEFGGIDSQGYVKNIGKIGESVILLLNCEKLLNAEEFNAIPVGP